MRAKHSITVRSIPYLSTETVYLATCSCGRYQSGKHVYPGLAEKAGRDHVASKMGLLFDLVQFCRELQHVSD